jgi:hypothetical protein
MRSPPLGELFDLLREDGFAVGVDDHVRIGRLLACEAAWTPEMLRTSVAALLVTAPAERRAFDACWERWIRSAEPAQRVAAARPPARAPAWRSVRRGILAACALAGVIAIVLAMQRWSGGPPAVPAPGTLPPGAGSPPAEIEDSMPSFPPPVPRSTTSGSDAPRDGEPPAPLEPLRCPTIKRPPASSSTATAIAVVALGTGIAILVLAAIAGAIDARARRRFLPGPWRYALAVPPATAPVLSRLAIEDAAADLAALGPETEHDLDLERSVAATVAQGGFPTPVRRRAPAAPHYLVLEDTAGGAERWRFVYDELFRGLTREGITVERYTFAANLALCTAADGHVVALGDLLDQADALIAIGDGDAAVDALTGERADWLVTLHYVPRRLWINPIPPARWSPGARVIAADTLMEHGVARALSAVRPGIDRPARPDSTYPAVIDRTPGTASAIAALRAALGDRAFRIVAAVSVVGPPTIALARWLAEIHELRLDEEGWLCVVTLPWFRTEQWPPGVRDRLSNALGSDAPELSRALAATSVRLRAASEPPSSSGAHLAWQLDGAYHAALHGERDAAARVLNRISGTPLAPQARSMLAALGMRDRRWVALLLALAIGATLVVGGIAYRIVEDKLESAAAARRAAERHLQKLAGDDARLPRPTGPAWPEAFAVCAFDGNGDPVPGARVVWSNPQLGPRSYVATTDAGGLSRASQIYSSPPRADLEQVAQLISTWNGGAFAERPAVADGERVVFRFAQLRVQHSGDAGPTVAAADPTPPADASGANSGSASDELARQTARCAELNDRRAWTALQDCATALERLGDLDNGEGLRAKAGREIGNQAKAEEVEQALRNGSLKAAETALHKIDDDSVYLTATRDAFDKTETKEMERVKLIAGRLAESHDCMSLQDYWAQLARTSTQRVVMTARAVGCKPDSFTERCMAIDEDLAVKQASLKYEAGHVTEALAVIEGALECSARPRLYTLAAKYACAARDVDTAQRYWLFIPVKDRPDVAAQCQKSGRELRVDQPDHDRDHMPCNTDDVDNLLKQAADQYKAGFAKTALQLINKALDCKQNVWLYRGAGIYACAAHDATEAQVYYAKVPEQFRADIIQRCRQEGIIFPDN